MSNPLNIERIAKANPRWLLFKLSYHLQNNFTVAIYSTVFLLVIGLAFYHFFPYDTAEIKSLSGASLATAVANILLYASIYTVALIGLIKITYLTATIEIETAITKVIGNKAAAKKRENPTEIQIDELVLITKAVQNPNIASAVLRLFSLITDEAQDKKFMSSSILMEPYRDESNVQLQKVSVYQRTALQLGILGTFIGLILGFKEMDFDNLDAGLDVLFVQLKYAFSTSIAGLVTSISLGLLLLSLRSRQEKYFREMETATFSVTALARRSVSQGALLNGLHEATNAFHQNSAQIGGLKGEVEKQNETLTKGMDQLVKAKFDFNNFIKELGDIEKGFMHQMESIYVTLGPEQLSDGLKAALEAATTAHLETTKNKFVQLNDLVDKTNANIQGVEKQLAKQAELHGANIKSQDNFIKTLTDTHVTGEVIQAMQSSSKEISGSMNKKVELLAVQLEQFSKQMEDFNNNSNRFFQKKHTLEKRVLVTISVLLISFFSWFYYTNFLA